MGPLYLTLLLRGLQLYRACEKWFAYSEFHLGLLAVSFQK